MDAIPDTTDALQRRPKGGHQHGSFDSAATAVAQARSEIGQATAEYAVLLAVVTAGLIGACVTVGTEVLGLFDQVVTAIAS